MRRARRCVVAVLASTLACLPARADAQLDPRGSWRTIETAHFRVHFKPTLEPTARHAAAVAERAWMMLSEDLVPPRAPVELVVADNYDYTNGYASVTPYNHIVVYVQPPIEGNELRLYGDWPTVLLTHELTHIFHIDRARGVWALGQHVFGRAPDLFPATRAPAWLTEGLAVYEESRITGFGRLMSGEHLAIALAESRERALPRLSDVSLATSRFPAGTSAYAFGSLLIDEMARTRGADHVREFVERYSASILPSYDRAAKRTFGISFSRAWKHWRDSLQRDSSVMAPLTPVPGWRPLWSSLWAAGGLRWRDSASLIMSAVDGRDVPGIYSLSTNGRHRRLARRGGAGAIGILPDGGLVYAQGQFLDPYTLRSDLYVLRNGKEHRLTHGARLDQPDTRRSDGAIVAVQSLSGSTRLVRVSADGRTITALTNSDGAGSDTLWSEPRWSPDGTHLVAVRHPSSGPPTVVVLDTLGALECSVAPTGYVAITPAWTSDGRAVVFESAAPTAGQVQITVMRDCEFGLASTIGQASDARTALTNAEPSPDDPRIAAVRLGARGFEVGVGRLDPSPARFPLPLSSPRALPPLQAVTAPSHAYSPARTILPRYWLPAAETTDEDEIAIGASTTGHDVIGRHAYFAQALIDTHTGEPDIGAAYRYARFGIPLVDFGFTHHWEHFAYVDSTLAKLGTIARRSQTLSAALTFPRPRVRSNSSLSIGVELERREFALDPASLDTIATGFDARPNYQSVFASGGWTNARYPLLSISPEDGVSLSVFTRQRHRTGADGYTTRTAIGTGRAYRSLPLPGFAHHVLALRGAGGWSDSRAVSTLDVGGTGGGIFDLIPGVTIGDEPRTFFVRGFRPATLFGIRALAGSAEYRFPIARPSIGIPLFSALADKISGAVFTDAATAWCPSATADSPSCRGAATEPTWIASAGAELHLDAALQYDVPYRGRVGVAFPYAGRELARRNATAYFTLGVAF